MASSSKNKEVLLQKIQDAVGALQKNFECPICLDLMKNPVSTKCDHKFCRMCILEAIGHKVSAPCPLCKEPFTKRSLQKLPKWNQIVTTVRSLSTAYQEDTGVLFSPSRQRVVSSPRNQFKNKREMTSDAQKTENKTDNKQECFIYVEEPSDAPPGPGRRTNTNVSLKFPTSSRKHAAAGKSNPKAKSIGESKQVEDDTSSQSNLVEEYLTAEVTHSNTRTAKRRNTRSSMELGIEGNIATNTMSLSLQIAAGKPKQAEMTKTSKSQDNLEQQLANKKKAKLTISDEVRTEVKSQCRSKNGSQSRCRRADIQVRRKRSFVSPSVAQDSVIDLSQCSDSEDNTSSKVDTYSHYSRSRKKDATCDSNTEDRRTRGKSNINTRTYISDITGVDTDQFLQATNDKNIQGQSQQSPNKNNVKKKDNNHKGKSLQTGKGKIKLVPVKMKASAVEITSHKKEEAKFTCMTEQHETKYSVNMKANTVSVSDKTKTLPTTADIYDRKDIMEAADRCQDASPHDHGESHTTTGKLNDIILAENYMELEGYNSQLDSQTGQPSQNRIFRYKGKQVKTPDGRRPRKSMIGTPTVEDPYSFKPSQKTPVKKKGNRKKIRFAESLSEEENNEHMFELFADTPPEPKNRKRCINRSTKPKRNYAKPRKPSKKQIQIMSTEIVTGSACEGPGTESEPQVNSDDNKQIESQLQDLIEKISQAEDFELVFSQQVREMEEKARQEQSQLSMLDDASPTSHCDDALPGSVPLNDPSALHYMHTEKNFAQQNISDDITAKAITGVGINDHPTFNIVTETLDTKNSHMTENNAAVDSLACDNLDFKIIDVSNVVNAATEESKKKTALSASVTLDKSTPLNADLQAKECVTAHRKGKEVIRNKIKDYMNKAARKGIETVGHKQGHAWTPALRMEKDLAPRSKSLDIKQIKSGKKSKQQKRKRMHGRARKLESSAESSSDEETVPIVDKSPAMFTASQQRWLVPRSVDSESDCDQSEAKKAERMVNEHDSDTDSLGVHPLPHEYESLEQDIGDTDQRTWDCQSNDKETDSVINAGEKINEMNMKQVTSSASKTESTEHKGIVDIATDCMTNIRTSETESTKDKGTVDIATDCVTNIRTSETESTKDKGTVDIATDCVTNIRTSETESTEDKGTVDIATHYVPCSKAPRPTCKTENTQDKGTVDIATHSVTNTRVTRLRKTESKEDRGTAEIATQSLTSTKVPRPTRGWSRRQTNKSTTGDIRNSGQAVVPEIPMIPIDAQPVKDITEAVAGISNDVVRERCVRQQDDTELPVGNPGSSDATHNARLYINGRESETSRAENHDAKNSERKEDLTSSPAESLEIVPPTLTESVHSESQVHVDECSAELMHTTSQGTEIQGKTDARHTESLERKYEYRKQSTQVESQESETPEIIPPTLEDDVLMQGESEAAVELQQRETSQGSINIQHLERQSSAQSASASQESSENVICPTMPEPVESEHLGEREQCTTQSMSVVMPQDNSQSEICIDNTECMETIPSDDKLDSQNYPPPESFHFENHLSHSTSSTPHSSGRLSTKVKRRTFSLDPADVPKSAVSKRSPTGLSHSEHQMIKEAARLLHAGMPEEMTQAKRLKLINKQKDDIQSNDCDNEVVIGKDNNSMILNAHSTRVTCNKKAQAVPSSVKSATKSNPKNDKILVPERDFHNHIEARSTIIDKKKNVSEIEVIDITNTDRQTSGESTEDPNGVSTQSQEETVMVQSRQTRSASSSSTVSSRSENSVSLLMHQEPRIDLTKPSFNASSSQEKTNTLPGAKQKRPLRSSSNAAKKRPLTSLSTTATEQSTCISTEMSSTTNKQEKATSNKDFQQKRLSGSKRPRSSSTSDSSSDEEQQAKRHSGIRIARGLAARIKHSAPPQVSQNTNLQMPKDRPSSNNTESMFDQLNSSGNEHKVIQETEIDNDVVEESDKQPEIHSKTSQGNKAARDRITESGQTVIEQSVMAESELVPPTPPTVVQHKPLQSFKKPLSITMEHVLRESLRTGKAAVADQISRSDSKETESEDHSESLLSSSKSSHEAEVNACLERVIVVDSEAEVHEDATVAFVRTLDADIFTADDEEQEDAAETFDPNLNPYSDEDSQPAVEVSSDEEDEIHSRRRIKRKTQVIMDESDDESSQGSDTGHSLNGTSSSALSMQSELLSSQHEEHMKEEVARIQAEIQKLEAHLAKAKQAQKTKSEAAVLHTDAEGEEMWNAEEYKVTEKNKIDADQVVMVTDEPEVAMATDHMIPDEDDESSNQEMQDLPPLYSTYMDEPDTMADSGQMSLFKHDGDGDMDSLHMQDETGEDEVINPSPLAHRLTTAATQMICQSPSANREKHVAVSSETEVIIPSPQSRRMTTGVSHNREVTSARPPLYRETSSNSSETEVIHPSPPSNRVTAVASHEAESINPSPEPPTPPKPQLGAATAEKRSPELQSALDYLDKCKNKFCNNNADEKIDTVSDGEETFPSQRVKSQLDIKGGGYNSRRRSPMTPITTLNRKPNLPLVSPRINSMTPSMPVTPVSRIKTENADVMSPVESDCVDFPQRPDWIITTSGIKKMKIKSHIEKFVKLIGARLSSVFTHKTTHVIMATGEDGDDPLTCQRTLKYFQGVAGGRWVLSHLWIMESLSKGQILPPEDYEIQGDSAHGMHKAPRRSRLRSYPLMDEFEICCYGTFQDLAKDDVHDLIEMVGGCMVQNPTLFSFDPDKRPVILVEDNDKKDVLTLRKIHKTYDVPVVAKDWLLDSIGCFKVQKISDWAVDLNKTKS